MSKDKELTAKDHIDISWGYMKDEKHHVHDRRHYANVHAQIAQAIALDRIATALEKGKHNFKLGPP